MVRFNDAAGISTGVEAVTPIANQSWIQISRHQYPTTHATKHTRPRSALPRASTMPNLLTIGVDRGESHRRGDKSKEGNKLEGLHGDIRLAIKVTMGCERDGQRPIAIAYVFRRPRFLAR